MIFKEKNKQCLCGKIFVKHPSKSYLEFSKRKYCSKQCSVWSKENSIQTSKGLIEQYRSGVVRTLGKRWKHSPEIRQMFCDIGQGKWMKGKKMSPESVEKRKLAISGDKHYRWISDRTKLAKASEQRNDSAHRDWSRSVKSRDGWKCKISNGDCSGRLEAHHILGWSSHPELRYQINNGITLCHYHHPRKRKEELKLSPYFQSLVLKAN